MEYGENTFAIEYEVGKIKEFEKKILAQNLCSSFLLMSFVSFEQVERANYNCSGYIPLENYEFENSKDMVELLEKCVFVLINSCGHLMNPRKYELKVQTVFYSTIKKEIRIAYVPKIEPQENASQTFIEFLNSLESQINHMGSESNQNEMCKYLQEITSSIENKNISLFDIVNLLGEIKQEIYACE